MVHLFLSNELTASSRLRPLKPLQFWCQVLEKLQLSTEAQILPVTRDSDISNKGKEQKTVGIVAAAGSLTDFVLPAAKSGLPADGLALTGFLEDGGKSWECQHYKQFTCLFQQSLSAF